jgi:thymidylate synthase
MTRLTADSMAELFSGAVTLAKSGEKVSPRGMATREVRDVHLLLTQPRARLLYAPPARIVNPAFAVAETVWHLSGSDASWIFDYNDRLRQFADDGVLLGAYGPRMRNWAGKVDQLAPRRRDPQGGPRLPPSPDPALRPGPGRRRAQGRALHPRLSGSTCGPAACTCRPCMRGQDVWIGMPYDVFFYTVLHELVAGWLGAELGEFHLHVSSLHIYERTRRAGRRTDLALGEPAHARPANTPGTGFAGLLDQVEARDVTGHPGWDAMAETLRSYRLWKDGQTRAGVAGGRHDRRTARPGPHRLVRRAEAALGFKRAATAGTR